MFLVVAIVAVLGVLTTILMPGGKPQQPPPDEPARVGDDSTFPDGDTFVIAETYGDDPALAPSRPNGREKNGTEVNGADQRTAPRRGSTRTQIRAVAILPTTAVLPAGRRDGVRGTQRSGATPRQRNSCAWTSPG